MQLSSVILRGSRAAQPDANSVAAGTVYYVTDESVTERSTGSAWEDISDGGSGVSDHGALTGLSDDDHSDVYPLITNFEADRATIATRWDDLTDGGETSLHSHASGAAAETDQSLEEAVLSSDPFAKALEAGTGRILDYVFVRKTADETISGTSTLQDDDHLVFAIDANEIWIVKYVLFYAGTSASASASDLKINWTLPSGATGHGGSYRPQTGTTSTTSTTVGVFSSQAGFTTDLTAGTVTTTQISFVIDAIIVNGVNPGNVQLQWAPNTTSDGTTVLTNSFLEAKRVA